MISQNHLRPGNLFAMANQNTDITGNETVAQFTTYHQVKTADIDGIVIGHYLVDAGGPQVGTNKPTEAKQMRRLVDYKDARPIALTDDVMLKVGFKYKNGVWQRDGFEVLLADGIAVQVVAGLPVSNTMYRALHELQNLYFYSTGGKELPLDNIYSEPIFVQGTVPGDKTITADGKG